MAAPQAQSSGGGGGGAQPSTDFAEYEEWRAQWTHFLRQAYQLGHYAADPGVSADALEADAGATKRAVLSLARQRGDILATLPPAKVQAVVRGGFPVDDRKTKNAHRRLTASVLDGRHLPPADGGPAELQDLLRMLLCLAACGARDATLFRPLVASAAALLPHITAAAAAPAPKASTQQGTARYMPLREPAENRQPGAQEQQREGPGSAGGRRAVGWYDGASRDGRGSGRGRGGAAGRFDGARAGGGRGGRGRGPERQQPRRQRPTQEGQQAHGSARLRWWEEEQQ